MSGVMVKPTTVGQLQEAVCSAPKIQPVGVRTKSALSSPLDDCLVLDMTGLSGILEYEPGEYTFTAYAGTPVVEISAALAAHNQFLPFDPLLVEAGATLGGAVASGLSGPGRYRYGGVRDYILGVRYVDGTGALIKGGGKVVKNAAGFDTPKLMVGSLGTYGVLAELTFKVFPAPRAYATLLVRCVRPEDAVDLLIKANSSQMDIHSLDVVPSGADCFEVWARISGLADALPDRLGRLQTLLGNGETLTGDAEQALWRDMVEMKWAPPDRFFFKVPLTPKRVADLETALAALDGHAIRRYGAGGQMAWIATSAPAPTVDALLRAGDLSGLMVLGPGGQVRLGINRSESFEKRIKAALDPTGRFPVR